MCGLLCPCSGLTRGVLCILHYCILSSVFEETGCSFSWIVFAKGNQLSLFLDSLNILFLLSEYVCSHVSALQQKKSDFTVSVWASFVLYFKPAQCISLVEIFTACQLLSPENCQLVLGTAWNFIVLQSFHVLTGVVYLCCSWVHIFSGNTTWDCWQPIIFLTRVKVISVHSHGSFSMFLLTNKTALPDFHVLFQLSHVLFMFLLPIFLFFISSHGRLAVHPPDDALHCRAKTSPP